MKCILAFIVLLIASTATAQPVRVGNKSDIETSILGEVLAELARQGGADAEANAASGGSGVVYQAIVAGEIDAYVEYTGTLMGATLSELNLKTVDELKTALAERGLSMTKPLGFNNTYALAVPRDLAERLDLKTTGDLADHAELRLAVSTEWSARPDGWPALKSAYGLPFENVAAVAEHRLLYEAARSGQADVIEVYTTEAAIAEYDLVVLEDDLGFFPKYEAFVLYRTELEETHPEVVAAWQNMAGSLDEATVTRLNALVEQDKQSPAQAASVYLETVLGSDVTIAGDTMVGRIWRRTLEHAWLVLASMAIGIAVAIPLGVAAAKHKTLGGLLLGGVGILQTIPSLALLVFMIPLLGLGAKPAIAALFLYSLLPMVRNTHAGLTGIPQGLRESARALGLTGWQRLTKIELPLAMPSILAGITTSAVITVGFATLGAFVSAGGYGQPILSGLQYGNNRLLLEGAIPAAAMAIAVQLLLDGVGRLITPRGMRG